LSPAVNLPGFSYSITVNAVTGTSDVSAVLCPENTYSPGLKKQRACVPCPTGFTTKGMTGMTRPEACSKSSHPTAYRCPPVFLAHMVL
jgi:hypothetical protein